MDELRKERDEKEASERASCEELGKWWQSGRPDLEGGAHAGESGIG